MKQVFISAISLQPNGNLRKILYKPKEFTLQENHETAFPIIPVIREYQSHHADNNEVIIILPYGGNAQKNYQSFLTELSEFQISPDHIHVLECQKEQSKQSCINLLLKLLDTIPDHALIYSDITYNTKPMSAMVIYAMQFIEKMKDVEVAGIFYGELERDENGKPIGSSLINITVFKYLSDIIEQLKILDVTDIKASLERLVGNYDE